MIVTTTPSIDGNRILEYKGVVYGEVIIGINFIKDFKAGLSNIFGGRSISYEEELLHARNEALVELQERARQMGGNAVVGVDTDYEILGSGNNMMMVSCSGTSVVIEEA